jgi:hypothetical protein
MWFINDNKVIFQKNSNHQTIMLNNCGLLTMQLWSIPCGPCRRSSGEIYVGRRPWLVLLTSLWYSYVLMNSTNAIGLLHLPSKANLSLGGTIKNVTPQIFVTHPTSKQHRTHIKKNIHSKLFIKRLPKSCKIQNFN